MIVYLFRKLENSNNFEGIVGEKEKERKGKERKGKGEEGNRRNDR
jgi:hypothetical protein